MDKFISMVGVLTFAKFAFIAMIFSHVSSAYAAEYKAETYQTYGYASAASTIHDTELKGGLRGAHVAANHHRENSYYPGYFATPTKENN
jgi:hypothetical protein